jgi:hypothetical protein
MSLLQIKVHGNGLTSFHEQVPKEILPIEYGGKAGSIAENWGEIMLFVFCNFKNFKQLFYPLFH